MQTLVRQLKKPWVAMPLVALLALGGWIAFKPDDGTSAGTGSTATEQVVEATVGTMAKTVSADGTVAAADTEDLSFGSAGTVTVVNVKAGDTVKEGQVLAEIDSAELQADVSAAESSLADAEAKLADDQDADASDAQLEADESSVTSARDQLAAAKEALEGAQLIATFDGTVASVNVTESEELTSGGSGGTDQTGSSSGSGSSSGDLPSGGGNNAPTGDDSSGSTDADISIVTTGKFTVELGFDSSDIANLAVGQIANVAISTSSGSSSFGGGNFPGGMVFPGGGAFPGGNANANTNANGSSSGNDSNDDASTDQAASPTGSGGSSGGVDGLVTEVGTVADASSGVASYPVTVAFADTSGDYNVGASVTVEITYEQVEDAVQVPAFAVTTDTDGTSTVKVKTSSGTETRTVTTGLTSGTMVQITSGLKGGESVVVERPGGGPISIQGGES